MLTLLNAMKQQPIGEQLDIEALSSAAGMPCAKINA